MKELTYATVCSGIECMSVASWGLPLKPVFFSEIEPFPCAVLKAHYPEVPNLGDMSKIQVHPIFVEPIIPTQPYLEMEITNGTINIRLHDRLDILAGGTPCQDVSVAGKRAGMQEGSGTRSSLAFDFVRLARELSPRYVVWENVSGAIDSRNAPDFLAFLRALGNCGYSLAWRVLDAQYVRVDGMERAVPQRRRRVWVVGCLGADESVPAQILFEPDCVVGNTPPRRRTGKGFAYSLARRDRVDAPVVGEATVALDGGQGGSVMPSEEARPTLVKDDHKGPMPAVVQCYENNTPNHSEVCRTLSGNHDDRVTDTGTTVVSTNSNGEDVAPTLTQDLAKQTGNQQQTGGGMSLNSGFDFQAFGAYGTGEVSSTLKAHDGNTDPADKTLVVTQMKGA